MNLDTFVENWERTRQGNRFLYSFKHAFIFAIVVTLIRDRNIFLETINGNNSNLEFALKNFRNLFLLMSVNYFFIVWWWKEKVYQTELKKNND